jgi:shikimate dehydrogenase
MKQYGLIGNPLTHSFSAIYFAEKFRREHLRNCRYDLFPISSEEKLPELIESLPELAGLNVTIPFKQKVLRFLDSFDDNVQASGSANCIRIERDHGMLNLRGFNTDIPAFKESIEPVLGAADMNALVLGTGGAASSVAVVLRQLQINFLFVSRNPNTAGQISYPEINKSLLKNSRLIINATPIGTYPESDRFPEIPYEYLTSDHILFDLVYNPEETVFLKKGKSMGARVKNGNEMLHLQAEKSWEIWTAKF